MLFLLPSQGITILFPLWLPSHGTQSSSNISNKSGSPLLTTILPVADCSSTDFSQSHGLELGAATCSIMGSFVGHRGNSVPPLIFMGCKGSACHYTLLHSFGTHAPSILTHRGICIAVSLRFYSSPKQSKSSKSFFPSHKYVTAEVLFDSALEAEGLLEAMPAATSLNTRTLPDTNPTHIYIFSEYLQ